MPIRVSQSKRSHLNLTPMIDVLFLLIIFFMVGAKFTELESSIDVKLPAARSAETAAESVSRAKQVVILPNGSVHWENATITDSELQERLRELCKLHPDTAVLIRSDAAISIQRLVEVMTACRNAGVLQQGLAFLPEDAARR